MLDGQDRDVLEARVSRVLAQIRMGLLMFIPYRALENVVLPYK